MDDRPHGWTNSCLLVLLTISHDVAPNFPQKSRISVWTETATGLNFLVLVFNATPAHVALAPVLAPGRELFGLSSAQFGMPLESARSSLRMK